MSPVTDDPVTENVITVEALPAQTNHGTSFATTFLYLCLGTLSGIFDLAAIRPVARLHRLWTNYYPRGAFGEEAVIMPKSTLSFIVVSLLSFAEIKSQGQVGFPFQTHPRAIMVAITSLLMYGFASGAEHAISATRLGPNSDYAIMARLGRMSSLCVLNHRALGMQILTPAPAPEQSLDNHVIVCLLL